MPIPIITVAQMREWEKVTWASGQTEEAVIRQAGGAVARLAEKITRRNDSILVLAGKGHNGDDARLAASQLKERRGEVLTVSDPDSATAELERLLQDSPALIIDGLFGIGLSRPLSAPWMKLIGRVNQARRPVLAVDVPSGLSADQGVPLDEAIRASWTLTLGAVKRGLVQATAWPFVGRLEVARDIGLVEYPFRTEYNLVAPSDFLGFPPPRAVHTHKGSFGHLLIVAGSLGYHGAAVLAARGAQRARPGLITLYTAENVYGPVAGQLQSVMVHPWPEGLPLPPKCSAVLLGPGLAASDVPEFVGESARRLWRSAPIPVIIDASALDWVAPGPVPAGSIRVLTPHPGEAARLLQASLGEVQNDRPQAVRQISKAWGQARVVLKGHQTVTGHGQEELFLNNSGNPHLAQGGSGDLLAGYLAGWLAQPEVQADPEVAIHYAVWQHGAAADALEASQPNWTVEDLASALGSIVAEEDF
jgi:hydroxyethylthiazole kinase-like uncharacterized protein yjeF